jgi:hypothetical protein
MMRQTDDTPQNELRGVERSTPLDSQAVHPRPRRHHASRFGHSPDGITWEGTSP